MLVVADEATHSYRSLEERGRWSPGLRRFFAASRGIEAR